MAEIADGLSLEHIAEGLRPLAVRIEDVRADPRNARRHPQRNLDAVQTSLARFGQRKPIVVNRQTGAVEAGNATLEAARRLGWQVVAVLYVDDDPATASGFAIADNRTAELAEWDDETLAGILRELRDVGELAPTGFNTKELDTLLRSLAAPARDGFNLADAAAIAPELVARVRPGSVWALGAHRLMCGDSSIEDDVAKLCAGELVSAIVCDPPYAIYGSSTGVGPDITDDKIVRPFFEMIFKLCRRWLEWFGHAYVCCDWRSWPAMWEACRRVEITARNLIVWDKGGQGLGSNYANCYELVGFFAKLPPAQGIGERRPRGQRVVLRPNLQRFDRPTGDDRQHNAAKPVELFEELIRNSSEAGGRVLDPFLGSGTTLVACERLGRAGLGMEIEPKWAAVTIARWEALTGHSAVEIEAPA